MMKYKSELNKLNKVEIRQKCIEQGISIFRENGKKHRILKELKKDLINVLGLIPRAITEDTGHVLEMAICLTLKIEYIGNFKYSMDKAQELSNHMSKLLEHITEPLVHTANGKGKYDYTGETSKLSAKSNKRGHMIAPQSIGQPTKNTFCQAFGFSNENDNEKLKTQIIQNIKNLLGMYFTNTFDCPILYYHEKKATIKLIQYNNSVPIDWNNQNINFSQSDTSWNESNTIRLEVEPGLMKPIGNFQFHNNRDCIKFRWNIKNLIDYFPSSFTVHIIH
jgi:hypothetical protein